ncbi:DUF262 domain-containing protein [Haliangium sp.]|uniref:DUF262 domain-containing protein n=1 Tax=Haliangium sp. TaxID=2663208 RepID=UPI003D0BB0EF
MTQQARSDETNHPTVSDSNVEGLDAHEGQEPWQDYPIDNLHVRSETRTLFEIVRRIKQAQYIMDPDFQRTFVWDLEKQSRLIESVIMRIPLPVFYLAESPEGKVIVVDGLQRLTTFVRFFNNDFPLQLKDVDLKGKTFATLPPKLQNRIEDAQLILYIIDSAVPERAKLDIFERVNSGVAITRQQMRNCLYQGKATRWLRDEADRALFLEVTGGSLRQSSMQDREFVNRFCSFALLGYDQHKGDVDDFLAAGLKHMNKLDDTALEQLSQRFQTSLKNNRLIFGKHAFRRQSRDQGERRNRLNAALFDVFSVLLADRDPEAIRPHSDAIQEGFLRLMDDADFAQAIGRSTNNPGHIRIRFEKAAHMLSEVLDADPSQSE